MNSRMLVGVALLCTMLAFAACSDDGGYGGGTKPTATSQLPTATPSAGNETPADGVGIPEVDDVVAAVLSNDAAKIRPLVRFVTQACAVVHGPGGPPPCGEGEAVGTEIEGLPTGTCEGEFRRSDDFDAWVTDTLMAESLFGVYEGPASQGADADYAAVFERSVTGQEASVAVSIDGSVIVYMKFSCGETAQELVDLLELGPKVFGVM